MKIHKVIFAAIICCYVQISTTSHDEDFIDPTDMEHYDQITKSLKSTLKEKESHAILKGLFQRVLKSAEKCGMADEENHYDTEVILTKQAQVEISNFLKDKPFNSETINHHLKTILINFKKHNKDEWKLKFKEFFQIDITQVPTLRIIENLFTSLLKRILEKAKKTGQKAIMKGKLHLDDNEMEINKFLNNEDWDRNKLEIILENVGFDKDEEVDILMSFWTFILGCVTSYALTWIMQRYYWREQAQKEEKNEEKRETERKEEEDIAEEIEDDHKYQEEINSSPTPETGDNKFVQNFGSGRESKPDAEQDQMDKCPSQRLQMSQKFTQYEKQDESHEQDNFISLESSQANTLIDRNERQEYVNIPNAKKSTFVQTLATTILNDAIESVGSEIQTEPDDLQDGEDLYSEVALEILQPNENLETHEQMSQVMSEQENLCSLSPNVTEIKDENSVETDQTVLHSLSNEKKQVALATIPGVIESTDSTDDQELLSSDTEAASAEKVNVDTVLAAHHFKYISMNVDAESDFIVINESAPESLTFVKNEDCDEPLDILPSQKT